MWDCEDGFIGAAEGACVEVDLETFIGLLYMHIPPKPLRLRTPTTRPGSDSSQILSPFQQLSLFPPSSDSRIDMFGAGDGDFWGWAGCGYRLDDCWFGGGGREETAADGGVGGGGELG